MTTLFISDLHLDASRPDITRLFVDFVRGEAIHAKALYILGDLFEAWIGDDAEDETGRQVADALAELHAHRVPCFYIHGNRDFLLGDAYARRARMTLLPDPSVIEIEGGRVLLMHGDTLCTDDVAYQTFRAQSRTPKWQRNFLERTLTERQAFAAHARDESQRYTRSVGDAITDVNPATVMDKMLMYDVRRMIHGHTHRPALHELMNDGLPRERIVLGDWYQHASILHAGNRELILSAGRRKFVSRTPQDSFSKE